MKFNFEISDLQYIIYKHLDDVIDSHYPFMESEVAYCTPSQPNYPNTDYFNITLSHYSSISFRVIPWYLKDDNTIGCYRIRFKYILGRKDDIVSLLNRNSELSKQLFEKFEIVLIGSLYSEVSYNSVSHNLEDTIYDIIAVRVYDIRWLLENLQNKI